MDFLSLRLANQRLTSKKFATVEDTVSYFGAIQSQDFSAAKWSLGLRIANATNETIEKAYNDGKILRTHVLRPTWHFVVPEDIQAFLALSAPRIKQFTSYYTRKLGLTEDVFKKTNTIIVHRLKGRNFLTRQEIKLILEKENITTDAQSLGHIVLNAEIDSLIISGPMRNKQFTYALMEERAPQVQNLDRDKALARLAEKYFTSHGPAQLKDFAWWSGLSVKDATDGIEMVLPNLEKIVENNKIYYLNSKQASLEESMQAILLLSVYDEYFISYTDRSDLYDEKYKDKLPIGNALLTSLLIVKGKVAGTWKRTIHKNAIEFSIFPFGALSSIQKDKVEEIIVAYGKFFNTRAEWEERVESVAVTG